MEKKDERFNTVQLIKRRMFAMRNGVIADALRKGGSPFGIIFGVNLPQLKEIASETGPDRALAETLWRNSTTRESMLIAPMLMPRDGFAIEDARRWISAIPAYEVADVLCHRLLRHQSYALDLAKELIGSEGKVRHYTGLRLMCNIAGAHPEEARAAGEAELARGDSAFKGLASLLVDE